MVRVDDARRLPSLTPVERGQIGDWRVDQSARERTRPSFTEQPRRVPGTGQNAGQPRAQRLDRSQTEPLEDRGHDGNRSFGEETRNVFAPPEKMDPAFEPRRLDAGPDILRVGDVPIVSGKKGDQSRIFVSQKRHRLDQGRLSLWRLDPTHLQKDLRVVGQPEFLPDSTGSCAFGDRDGRVERFRPRARLRVNSADPAIAAALSGRGITRVLSYMIASELAAGSLELVLERFTPPAVPVHVVHKEPGQTSARIRAVVDHLVESLCADRALNPA